VRFLHKAGAYPAFEPVLASVLNQSMTAVIRA